MYVYFKIRGVSVEEPSIRVMAVFYVTLGQGVIDHTSDVVWRVTPEGIEWLKDRYNDEHGPRRGRFGHALIADVTNGMINFANALCATLDLSGTTKEAPDAES